jgi:hypothetical protein
MWFFRPSTLTHLTLFLFLTQQRPGFRFAASRMFTAFHKPAPNAKPPGETTMKFIYLLPEVERICDQKTNADRVVSDTLAKQGVFAAFWRRLKALFV